MLRDACVALLVMAGGVGAAGNPIEPWMKSKGYKVRANPGSFHLVGDTYPDKDRVGQARFAKLAECFPNTATDEQQLESATEVLDFGRRDIGFLVNITRRNPVNQEEDIGKLQAEFGNQKIRYVTLSATDLKSVAVSTMPLQKNAAESCKDALFNQKLYVVSDAVGAGTLQYTFYDERGTSLKLEGSVLGVLAPVLAKVGLSRSSTTAGTAAFSSPVFLGFGLVQWDGKKFKPVR